MGGNKKEAARQAAAKFSTDPMSAAVEYGKLTKQIDSLFEFDESNMKHFKVVIELRDEMLELLRQYRHPTADIFAESMIFIDPNSIQIKGKMHQEPEFLILLKKESLPASVIEATEKYVKESEMAKLDFGECKHELEEVKKTIEKANRIYKGHQHERSETRNALVVQSLGLSTGLSPKRINKEKAYIDYLTLVRKKGLSRKDATQEIKELHGFNSYDAALKALHDYRTALIGKWKEEVSDPETLERINKWLEGFILPRR